MSWIIAALAVWLAGGILSAAMPRGSRGGTTIGALSAVLGAVLGMPPVVLAIAGQAVEVLRWNWPAPYGEFHLELDALSAWFMAPLLVLSALSAIYGHEYLTGGAGGHERKAAGPTWFFYNVLVASMAVVLLARNAVLFLVAWEVMALASFFLVTFEDEQPQVRDAGWVYLVATHLGTAFLLAFFLIAGREAGTLDMTKWTALNQAGGGVCGALFVLAVVGFGTKAGFMPLHVWLPEAHPAAPSHVSALMSGIMIKTGIYGLVRFLSYFENVPAWWGWALIAIGLSSGVLGVLFAQAQHDLKRLLAYHSVENIGIITLGLGLGLVGLNMRQPVLALLGFGGGLLHVVNHALFKGLLFLAAGSVLHGCGTRQIELLGGLVKRMPWTGACFFIGSAAICGLPPLNGFISELMLFAAGFAGITHASATVSLSGVATLGGLALISGLAAACFAKAFGIVFLGKPRDQRAAHAHESGWAMVAPMLVLAVACAGIGLFSPWVLAAMRPVLGQLSQLAPAEVAFQLGGVELMLAGVAFGAGAFLLALVLLNAAFRSKLRRQKTGMTVTWDCGYAQPTARMQYTGSSFAQPLLALFEPLLQTKQHRRPPDGLFPKAANLETETPDLCRSRLFHPVFMELNRLLGRLRWLQQGQVQLYVLYIALTLVALLAWKLGGN